MHLIRTEGAYVYNHLLYESLQDQVLLSSECQLELSRAHTLRVLHGIECLSTTLSLEMSVLSGHTSSTNCQ